LPKIQIPQRRGRRPIKERTEAERRALYQMVQQFGYNVLLDLMHDLCEEEDTRLINTEPANKEEVLAAHVMAKSRWNFFVDVQGKVEQEINELFGHNKGPLAEGASEYEVLPPLDENEV
jgi:hypothetical protein